MEKSGRGELLGRIRPDFAQRRVVMRNAGEITGGGTEMHGDDDFVDQLRRLGAGAGGADNSPGLTLSEEFHNCLLYTSDAADE